VVAAEKRTDGKTRATPRNQRNTGEEKIFGEPRRDMGEGNSELVCGLLTVPPYSDRTLEGAGPLLSTNALAIR